VKKVDTNGVRVQEFSETKEVNNANRRARTHTPCRTLASIDFPFRKLVTLAPWAQNFASEFKTPSELRRLPCTSHLSLYTLVTFGACFWCQPSHPATKGADVPFFTYTYKMIYKSHLQARIPVLPIKSKNPRNRTRTKHTRTHCLVVRGSP
jgi:hypothetical protein